MASVFRLIFHSTVLCIYLFSIFYDFNYTTPPPGTRDDIARSTYGGRFKHLTFINVAISQVEFFALCVIGDLLCHHVNQPSRRGRFQTFCDILFSTIVSPLAMFVSSSFWGLYAIDRNLIYEEEKDTWHPQWLNHCYHTLPFVAVLFEMLLTHHKYPKGLKKYLPLFLVFVSYTSWLLHIALTKDYWVYPVMEVLGPAGKVAFIVGINMPPYAFVYVGEKLNRLYWGNDQGLEKFSIGKKGV